MRGVDVHFSQKTGKMAFMTAVMSIFILTLTGLLECLDFVLVTVQYISNEGKLLIGAAYPSSSEKG